MSWRNSWKEPCSGDKLRIGCDVAKDDFTTFVPAIYGINVYRDNKVNTATAKSLQGADDDLVVKVLNTLRNQAHLNAISKGFHDDDKGDGHYIALIHGELSECLEASRHGNPPDSHLPDMEGMTVELADVLIRVFDFAGKRNMKLGEAVVKKMQYNSGRPHLNGKLY